MDKPDRKKTEEEPIFEKKKETDMSPRKVMFRAKDKELCLIWKAPYTSKDSNGMSVYHQGEKAQFVEFMLEVEDIPENRRVLEKLRSHPQNGVSFREVPSDAADDVLDIKKLKEMEKNALVAVAKSRGKNVTEEMSKEAIILAIIE